MKHWRDMDKYERKTAILAALEDRAGSAKEIASKIDGATRNSIIGFCTRNEITLPGHQPQRDGPHPASKLWQARARAKAKGDPNPIAAEPSGHRKPVSIPKPVRAPEPEFIHEGKPFIDLAPGECKWPLWDRLPLIASQAKHCGAPAGDGPWCEHHQSRARLKAAS